MKLEFRCRICKEMRPDAQISVVSVDRTPEGMRADTIRENINYCNDRPMCREGAVARSKVGMNR